MFDRLLAHPFVRSFGRGCSCVLVSPDGDDDACAARDGGDACICPWPARGEESGRELVLALRLFRSRCTDNIRVRGNTIGHARNNM